MKRESSRLGPDDPYIVATDLSLRHPLRSAYRHVDLTVARGSLCAVVGENGSGKCELLLTLAGRMRQTGGKLEVGGYPLPLRAGKVRKLSGLGFFEKVNEVQPSLSVRSVTAAELNLNSRRSGRKATMAYLEQWGLADRARDRVESLRRMDYVRFGIALGMACDPGLLVVDDIESDLTHRQSVELLDELREIAHEGGVTVVVSITDPELALLCDERVPIGRAPESQEDPAPKSATAVEGERPGIADEYADDIADDRKGAVDHAA